MRTLIVYCLVLLSVLKAGLYEKSNKMTMSNAANCSLLNSAQCLTVGACVTEGQVCKPDPCLERTVTSQDKCKENLDVSCAKINTDTVTWCVSASRVEEFTNNTAYRCSLEWGEYKVVEYGLCKTWEDCGPVSPIKIEGETYYVCGEGPKPKDPCVYLNETVCPYVGLCMWANGMCVEDGCWEATYSSLDKCKGGCGDPKVINPGGTPQYGYCKTPGHDLHSPCNVATSTLTTIGLCTWPGTGIPGNCKKTTTISKFDGDDLYVCDPEEQTFKVDGAYSLNSFLVALSTLVLMIVML